MTEKKKAARVPLSAVQCVHPFIDSVFLILIHLKPVGICLIVRPQHDL